MFSQSCNSKGLFWILLNVPAIFLFFGCAASHPPLPLNIPPPPHIPAVQPSEAAGPARTLYVDQNITQPYCETYLPAARSCKEGSGIVYRELAKAAVTALPGDTVLIREGIYPSQLNPARSGAPGAQITYKSYPGETVTLTGLDKPAIFLQNRSHIVIEGLTISKILGWGRLENSHFNIIRNNHFIEAEARGTTGGLKLVKSHYNKILDNSFETGNDSVVIQESDRNLLAGNKFRWARHSLLSVRCGNFNVVRGNHFHNERQKAMEIYDCEGVSDAPFMLDSTKRNLIEGNRFVYTRGPSAPHKYNAIQYCGQLGVVRRNVFHDNQGGGIHIQVYKNEALYNYGHRIYNNTFYANLCYGFASSNHMGARVEDNLLVNNIFYKNEDCKGRYQQMNIGNPGRLTLRKNAILESGQDPFFVSAEKRNLWLQGKSPMIDAGVFLTFTRGAGGGKSMPVADVKYFYDGYGINGEIGDTVQLEGGKQTARIVAIDYGKNFLVLNRPLTWRDGQGVALAYEGVVPDLGAFEYSAR